MPRRFLIPALLGSGACSLVAAAEPAASKDDLAVVTIVGITPYGKAEQSARDVAGAVQSADAQDLDRSHASDLGAFLNRRLGSVYVNESQGNPLQPDVNYRGFTASPLLGTPQGISVYLDGVRLNQPFGDVVSWDLIPRAAIQRMELVSGSSPLFGVNSLGGALSLHTKDGYSAPGTTLHVAYGSHDRRQIEAETGGHSDAGLYWYATANQFRDAGWRNVSPSDAKQGFARFGWRDDRTDLSLTASGAGTDLTGNGLQDFRLLQQDYASVYTKPDNTRNRSGLLNLRASRDLGNGVTLSGNAWYRNIRTVTYNGDVNEAALGENLYQPNAAERAALTAAGFTGFPTSGETQENTPFPFWRCIANALLNTEPNEKCNGLVNRTSLSQHNAGAAFQVHGEGDLAGHANRLTAGLVYDESRAHFAQSAQFAYLAPDRGLIGVNGPGAYADGSQDSENAFDSRVDLDGRTRTQSAYVVDSFALTQALRANLAARYDSSHTRTVDAITPGGGAGSLDGAHRYSRLNPALSLVFQASPAMTVYGSYSEASRAPSAIELGCADPANPCRLPNAMAGDPPLAQVVTKTWEAGLRGDTGPALQWNATVFRADSHDDILFVADNQAGFGYFRNFGKTRRQGFELGATGRLAKFTLDAHYTWLDATYRSAETLNGGGNSSNDGPAPGFDGAIDVRPGDRLPLIPRHILKTSVQWDVTPVLALDVDVMVMGRSPARGNENGAHEPDGTYYLGEGYSGGYAVWNLGAEWRPTRRLTAYLQLDNILDRRYATAAQLGTTPFTASGEYVARPFAAPVIGGERPLLHTTFLAPGAPRSVLVGVRFRFGDS